MGEDEDATIRTLTTYRELMSTRIQKHRGRVVDSPGDNLLAEFGSVVDAVYVRTEFSEKMLCKTDSITAITPGKKVYASIRPEDVEVFTEPPQARDNLFKGTIVHKAYLGNFLCFFVSVDGTMIRVQIPYQLPREEGQELYLFLNPQKCIILF